MSSNQLPRSILLALGIAACPKSRRGDLGPCLSPVEPPPPPEETDDTGEAPEAPPETAPCLDYPAPSEDTGELGPCLKYIAPVEDSGELGPCLEYAIPPDPEPKPEGGDPPEEDDPEGASLRPGERARSLAARSVLERGVLPDDVAAILRDRRGSPA